MTTYPYSIIMYFVSDTIIVTPTLGKRLDTLRRTILSVIDQSFKVDYVIAHPPHALNNLANLKREFPQIFFESIEGNLASTVNQVLFRSNHLYANWIGDDDILLPNSIQLIRDSLESDQNAVLSFGGCLYINQNSNRLGSYTPSKYSYYLLGILPGAIKLEGGLFRLKAFKNIGGLNSNLKFTPDVELVLKLRTQGTFIKVSSLVSGFGIHADSDTTSKKWQQLAEAKTLQLKFGFKYERFFQFVIGFTIRSTIFLIFKFLNYRSNK
jgi:hypothetical protein